MKFDHLPFPAGWWGTGLENVGLKEQRPDVGTYGCYDFASLPPVPLALQGDFAWLADAPTYTSHIGLERSGAIAEMLPKLLDACREAGVALPVSFATFMGTPHLQASIRSNTDCFLDLPDGPVASPVGDGALLRFLADSQGCLFWYLYVPTDSSDHAVVCSPDYYAPDAEDFYNADGDWNITTRDPRALVFTAPSFEAFLCRFWIENELWFSEYDGRTMSDICRRYLEAYRRAHAHPLCGDY